MISEFIMIEVSELLPEREEFLERHSRIGWTSTATIGLSNMAFKELEGSPPERKLGLDFRSQKIGGLTVELTAAALLEEKDTLQKELVNQWFLMYYANFEFFFSQLCLRAYREKGLDDAIEVQKKIVGSWEKKFCKISQELGVKLGRNLTRPWMSKNFPKINFSGEVLDDPTKLLDNFRKVRNYIMHNNSKDENGVALQANFDVIALMLVFLAEASGLIEKAFVKEFGWELQSRKVESF